MTTLLVAMALLLQDTPIKPLSALGKRIDAGGAEFMKGTAPADAWKPWAVQAKDVAALREALKAAGVTKLSCMSFEFELFFVKDKKVLGQLRTYVYVEGDDPCFMGFEFRPAAPEDTVGSKTLPLDSFKEFAPEAADAAKALVAAIKSREGAIVKFADIEKISKRCSYEALLRDARKTIDAGKKNFVDACGKVAALDYPEVLLRLDDQSSLALGEDGAAKGMVTSQFAEQGGKPAFELGRYRGFKKRP